MLLLQPTAVRSATSLCPQDDELSMLAKVLAIGITAMVQGLVGNAVEPMVFGSVHYALLTSHHVTSHHVTSHHITSHHVTDCKPIDRL